VRELSGMLAPCRCCLRLNDAELCRECLITNRHRDTFRVKSFGGKSRVSRERSPDFAASAAPHCRFLTRYNELR
jgi:hypothetical protein